MEHPFAEGDSVQLVVSRDTGQLTTGVVVALPNEHGDWEVRVDGESTTRLVRESTIRPLAS